MNLDLLLTPFFAATVFYWAVMLVAARSIRYDPSKPLLEVVGMVGMTILEWLYFPSLQPWNQVLIIGGSLVPGLVVGLIIIRFFFPEFLRKKT